MKKAGFAYQESLIQIAVLSLASVFHGFIFMTLMNKRYNFNDSQYYMTVKYERKWKTASRPRSNSTTYERTLHQEKLFQSDR